MNEIEPSPSPTTLEIEVIRDPAFVRLSADQGVCTYLGHDIELTLLLMSQAVDQQIVTIDGQDLTEKQVRLRRDLCEMARVRMSPSTGKEIAFGILQRLLEAKIMDAEDIKSNVEFLFSSTDGSREGGSNDA